MGGRGRLVSPQVSTGRGRVYIRDRETCCLKVNMAFQYIQRVSQENDLRKKEEKEERRSHLRHMFGSDQTATAYLDEGGKESSEVPPRESRGIVLLQWSLSPFVYATVDRGECKASSFIQVPPLPTFVL